MDSDIDADILARFVRDGRVVLMPTKRSKRLVVLDHIAQSFEPGQTYPEYLVNRILHGYYDDYAALRRYLVDEQFLARDGNVYWRSGGTVSV